MVTTVSTLCTKVVEMDDFLSIPINAHVEQICAYQHGIWFASANIYVCSAKLIHAMVNLFNKTNRYLFHCLPGFMQPLNNYI